MLYVELADTPDLWRQGLMFRKHLADNSGMLFKFDSPQILKFWGMNTFIPLDIAFVDRNNEIIKIGRIKDMSLSAVSSDDKCIMAIEANDGFFSKQGVRVGDKVDITEDFGQHLVKFIKNEKDYK